VRRGITVEWESEIVEEEAADAPADGLPAAAVTRQP